MPATASITGYDPTIVCIERARSILHPPFRNKEEVQGVPAVSTQMPHPDLLWMSKGWRLMAPGGQQIAFF